MPSRLNNSGGQLCGKVFHELNRVDGLIVIQNLFHIGSCQQDNGVFCLGCPVVLMDTSARKINAADFEYIPGENLVIVPTFFCNRIVAYQLR
jgi:hypothetical protein